MSQENDKINALERVRRSPVVGTFSFKNNIHHKMMDLDNRKSNTLTEEMEEFTSMLQNQMKEKNQNNARKVIAKKVLTNNKKNALVLVSSERHKFF